NLTAPWICSLLYPRFLPLASNVVAPLAQSPAHTTRNFPHRMPHPYRAGVMRGLPPAGAALVSLWADGQDSRRPNFTAARGARLPFFSIVSSGTRLRKAPSFIQCTDYQGGVGLVARRIGHESRDVDPALSAD